MHQNMGDRLENTRPRQICSREDYPAGSKDRAYSGHHFILCPRTEAPFRCLVRLREKGWKLNIIVGRVTYEGSAQQDIACYFDKPTATDRKSAKANFFNKIPDLISDPLVPSSHNLLQSWYRIQLHDHYKVYKMTQSDARTSFPPEMMELPDVDDERWPDFCRRIVYEEKEVATAKACVRWKENEKTPAYQRTIDTQKAFREIKKRADLLGRRRAYLRSSDSIDSIDNNYLSTLNESQRSEYLGKWGRDVRRIRRELASIPKDIGWQSV
ncbi:uncharacterized protein BDZ99DRAFT_235308 [Mytilinidion resinicola]|uniref:Uncharacterized protein n=1 Tax=Mytilinidion resinicola TaxID=574789 RepID=A0A6A6YZZ5_9PEZI|nr:uncharacterized protein BDZ99DRAFT_235308 [Mytilinidion resinicola]KAF2814330.1 hypothetical protein BDZ99DRAFT_235308 [Mytilinidion resinicola]